MKILEFFRFLPSMRAFKNELLKGMAREGLSGWSLEAGKDALVHQDGMVLNLANFHCQYVNARRADRPRVLSECLAMAAAVHREIPLDWQTAKDAVFLAIRSRFDHATMDVDFEAGADASSDAVAWPLAGDLVIRLVYDFETHLTHVRTQTLQRWAEPENVVFEQALQNLAELEPPGWTSIGAGVFQLDSTSCYSESFMLLDALHEALPFDRHAAMIAPNRGILLAADRRSESAVLAMVDEAIRLIQTRPWPMSGAVLVRDGGRWQEFAATGELARRMHVLHTINMSGVYRDQKSAIDEFHESIDRDIFVASHSILERQGGLLSWSTLGEGIDTLLPRTDIVMLGRSDGGEERDEVVPVRWEDFERILGGELQTTSLCPPCYLIRIAPDASQWTALKSVMIDL